MKQNKKRAKWKKRVAAVLALAAVCMSFNSFAAWDGYNEAEKESKAISLANFNNAGAIMKSGAVPAAKHTSDGNLYSACWSNRTAVKNLYFSENIPRDWTEYEKIEIAIYSEKASNGTAMFLIETESAEYSYYSIRLSFDWEGLKVFSLPLTSFTRNRSADWSKVTRIRITVDGWNTVISDPAVYFGSIKVMKGDGGSLGSIYDSDTIARAEEGMSDAAAIYGGRSNVVTGDGEVSPLGAETLTVDETTLAPQMLFSQWFGADVKTDGEKWTMTMNGKTLEGNVGSASYAADGKAAEFKTAVISRDGQLYLPAAEAAAACGKKTVTDGKLVIIGNDSAVDLFVRNYGVNEYTEIIAYLAGHVAVDADKVTAENCAKVKDNWRYYLTGNEEDNDISDPNIAEKINSIAADGQTWWNKMIKTSGHKELFEGIVSTESAQMTSAYNRLYRMAMAYGTAGSSLYHNQSLKADILYGLEWLNKNRYGQAEIDGKGWRDTGAYNWWDWDIGVPSYLIPTLMIMESELTAEQTARYLKLLDLRVQGAQGEGSNAMLTARAALGSALLQNDAKKVLSVQSQMDTLFLYVDNGRNSASQLYGDRTKTTKTKGHGFYTDGSYIHHTLHPMNGTYGLEQLTGTAPILSIFAGTVFEFTCPQADNAADWIYNSFEPLIYQGAMFRMVEGREPGNEHGKGTSALSGYLGLLNVLSPEDKEKVKSIIKRQVNEDTSTNFYTSLGMSEAISLSKIMKETNNDKDEEYKINKVYYNEDKVVHQRGDFAMGVSMSSSRIFNYECINSQNMKGWYVGDGMIEYRVKGDFNQSKPAYWNSINPYRLPGTTVDTQERKAVSIAQGNEYLSSKDFVGGVSDGEYGAAAMWLESYHNDADFGPDNGTYGGPAPAHDCNLQAKKSYFMFDDEVVCLGADINASNGYDVLTVVDNRLAVKTKKQTDGPEAEKYNIAGVEASETPEAENVAENTLDGEYTTKWAAKQNAAIVWDLGEVKKLGFIVLSFQNGSHRKQKFDLEVSSDGKKWVKTFSGMSSGETELDEAFTLNEEDARYVRFTNKGNSGGSEWVSITTAKICAPNADGSIGVPEVNITGDDTFTADGEVREITAEDVNLNGVSWAHLEGSGGYYFPQGGNLFSRWYRDTNSFLELWINHGKNPSGEKYAYVMLPGKTAEETKAYAQNPDIEILQNTPKLQAVRENNLGITQIVFWEAGEYDGIKVNQPMMVMIRTKADGIKEISVSDPTQKLKSAQLTVEGRYNAVSSDVMINTSSNQNTLLNIDFTDSDGRSMTAELSNVL